MAQSREVLTALTLNQQFEEALINIKSAVDGVFIAAGYNDIFDCLWAMGSPKDFPCDNLGQLNTYYSKHANRILMTLEAIGLHNLPMDKKLVLKAVSDLCHSLARIKYIIDKLSRTLPKAEYVSATCREVQAQLNPVATASTWNSHDINREITRRADYFNAISHHLMELGYLRIDNSPEQQTKGHHFLPEALKPDLTALKSNNALNELIESIESVKKAGRDTGLVSQPLNDEINTIRRVQCQLEMHNQEAIQGLEAILAEINAEKHQLAAVLSTIDANAYIYDLCSILREYEDERICPSLNTAINRLKQICAKSIPYFCSNSVRLNMNNAFSSLSAINENLVLFIQAYTGSGMNIFQLRLQCEQLKSQHQHLSAIVADLSERIEHAKEASQRHQLAISNTVELLQGHLRPVKSDSVSGFIRRHWDIMAAGGAIGGTAAVAAVLISTNPILLTVCIGSGIVLGAVGGSGGGLLHDAITERNQHKHHSKAAVNPSARLYGSFWRPESQSAAAAAATTSEPSTTVAPRK